MKAEYKELLHNSKRYIQAFVKIKDKQARIVPLKLNTPQLKLYNALMEQKAQGKPQRAIVLKARQMGFSTLTEAVVFHKTATRMNSKSAIVAHDTTSTNNLLRMFKLMYDKLPHPLQPTRKNSNEKAVIFDKKDGGGLGSEIKCYTAGASSIGRGETIQNLHISEYAFWGKDKADLLLGLLQTVPNLPSTMVVIESTANGFDDFKRLWDRAVAGVGDYVAVFCAWWELEEYRIKTTLTDSDLTDEERQLKALYNLNCEQIAWRRKTLENECGGDIDKFKQEYPSCPEEAFISTGQCVFDKQSVINRINIAPQPIRQGYFDYKCEYSKTGDVEITDIKFVEKKNGIIKIFTEPMMGHPYVIGGDTAGDTLGDNFTAYGIDNTTSVQVCSLQQQTDEDLYSKQMFCLGKYYNNALIGIESNYTSYPLKFLERAGYGNLYVEQKVDDITQAVTKRYGFRTTSANRSYILAELKRLVREDIGLFKDIELLKEMLVFVKNERGREEAMQGEHDDNIMASAICYHCRSQQGFEIKQEQKKAQELPGALQTKNTVEEDIYGW